MSASCRDLFDNVGLVLVHVRRGRPSVGTCSSMSVDCRYVFGEVGFVSGLVRRSRVSVETCSVSSG